MPNGVFAPAVCLGALIGRFYGEFVNMYCGGHLSVRMASVAGAAGYAAVITRTISPILILLELTGEMKYSMAVFISTLLAYSVSSIYTMSFFDTVLNIKKMAYLPVMYNSHWNAKRAIEIFDPCQEVLYEDSLLIDLVSLFAGKDQVNKKGYIPVLKSETEKKLIGSVNISNALDY